MHGPTRATYPSHHAHAQVRTARTMYHQQTKNLLRPRHTRLNHAGDAVRPSVGSTRRITRSTGVGATATFAAKETAIPNRNADHTAPRSRHDQRTDRT